MADATIGASVAAIAPALAVIDGNITTTSIQVAEHFGKQHKLVMRAIRNLLESVPQEYRCNFAPVEYTDEKGERRPAYRITRDGFTLLAMGFTGKEALQWKLAYLDAFNQMERQLLGQVKTPYSVQPHQSLSADEAAMLRDLISNHAKTLPKEQQADFIIKAWSKLKAHFGVSYRQIPEREFSEAVSIIGRHMAAYTTIAAPKPLEVDRTKIEHIYTDLGRLSKFAADLQSRINGLGMRDEDLPPQWWQAKRLPPQIGA